MVKPDSWSKIQAIKKPPYPVKSLRLFNGITPLRFGGVPALNRNGQNSKKNQAKGSLKMNSQDPSQSAALFLEEQLRRENPDLPADLRASLARLGAHIVKDTKKPEQPEKKPQSVAQLVLFPSWADDKRGTPNCFLRSALFAAIYGNAERKHLKKALLAVQGDTTIHYTGDQLSQSDLDFVMAAIHLARQHPLGHICHVRGYSFLKIMGRSDSKPNYLWLDDTITRLIACSVKIRIGTRVYEGSILSSCTRDEDSDIYKMVFDPDFVRLFGVNDWTAIDWTTRQKLSRSPLAQWIYDYAVSHVGTVIKTETLQKLSGREADLPKVFNQALKRAAAMLEKEASVSLTVDQNGLITIGHKRSPSQLRHAAKKAARKTSKNLTRRTVT